MVAENASNMSDVEDDDNLDEEPGEVIQSAPPLKVGEERPLGGTGIIKKLLKKGHGWETPELGDEVTVYFVGVLMDGTRLSYTRDRDEPLMFKLGGGLVFPGLDQGIITMKKGEHALFTIPSELGYGAVGGEGIPPNMDVQFEVELISWITVVDVCKDGGIIKKILETGERNEKPGDLDEVLDASGEEKDFNNGLSIPPKSALYIDLQLVSFKPVVDVIGDSKVSKKILKEGEGGFTANEGATVTIRYVSKLADGTVYEKKGFEGEQPFTFITDEEQVIVGLDQAAATMKKGEQAIVTVNHEYGYRSLEVNQDLAVVPPFSDLVYEVEMLDFVKERAPWEMNSQERIEAARKNKEEGNRLFKPGKYQRAAKKYEKATDYVSEDGTYGDDEEKLVKELRVSCSLNGAACSLKLHDFQGALSLCSMVLEIEFQNVKALYRRAQAYRNR